MNTLDNYITEYLEYCKHRKRLDVKTIKAYRIDLKQYSDYAPTLPKCFLRDTVDVFITSLHKQYEPKTILFHSIQKLLSTLYKQKEYASSDYQLRCCIRDIAVVELLFATGMRIFELCSSSSSVDIFL